MAQNNKARFWTAVLYPESMIENWEDELPYIIQYPYAYCLHDRCVDSKGNPRKPHIHIMVAYGNTTTYNSAYDMFQELCTCELGKIERVKNVRYMYDYLIHDTDDCYKKGKILYKPSERICGNGFDIGAYEQISASDKAEMCKELGNCITEMGFTNFSAFYRYVCQNYDDKYFDILMSNSGFFDRIIRGVFYEKYDILNVDRFHSIVD